MFRSLRVSYASLCCVFALDKEPFIASVTLLSAMSGLTTQTGMAVAAARKVAEKVTIGAGSSSGRIAMRNAIEKSLISHSISETAPRVLSLQRDMLRSVPWVKRAYAVVMPESVSLRPATLPHL